MAAARIVGIDLGTTHTVVAWAERGAEAEPQVFAIPQLVSANEQAARPLLPSHLYAPLGTERVADPWGDAPWLIGEYARRRGQELPRRSIASAKSWLSHARVDRRAAILPWGEHEGNDVPRISPVEASQRILLHVRRAYNAAFPKERLEHQQVVLTVPASFDQVARELTVRAATEAGLHVRLLEEPQAAFYDYMQRAGSDELAQILGAEPSALVLVCDVGGGTTDLTLIRLERSPGGALAVARVAVGRHLLLGGDNMDLALAHTCEARLVPPPERLDATRFSELVLACRSAKEQLLAPDAPGDVPIHLLASGSSLVGRTLTTRLSRDEVRQIVLEGFFPHVDRDAAPERRRAGIVAFGLPYEQDPAITRHLVTFFSRHAPDTKGPRALLLNGGVFRSEEIARRVRDEIASWGGPPLRVLDQPHPDLAVARGALVYGLALSGHGVRISGGSAHGYYLGVEGGAAQSRAVCVVPRGSQEGERHVTTRPMALKLGRPVRFELFAADSGPVHAPGQIVSVDGDAFERLPPVATSFESETLAAADLEAEIPVVLEGELTALGTLELACVETGRSPPRRFRLAFELRGNEPELDRRSSAGSEAPPRTARSGGQRLEAAFEAIQRVFGKGRSDVKPRETKDLLRELERLLGERASWNVDVTRALFDVLAPKHRARRRSVDHERVYWMLCGYCLRPGFGHPLDPGRVALVQPLFQEGLAFPQEARGWQQFFIAWRRMAGGLPEAAQVAMRQLLDPFLAPAELKLSKPKSFKPQALDELLELASWLERVPAEQRSELARYVLERTWTAREPVLWATIGRFGPE
jgi:molecular chaperone DnaK (HSP70)